MGGLSLIVAVMPTMSLVALCAGLALTRIAGRRTEPSDADGWLRGVDALMRVAAGRKTWPPNTEYRHCGAVEYLYVPCVRMSGNGSAGEPRRWVQAVPIVKKTAKLIYYASDSWDRREAVVSPGCISREAFETDTWGYQCGVIPVPGDRHLARPPGRLFFATRQAAERHLRCGEREPARQAAPPAALIKELRRAMLDAHPDRGGTAERFIQARCRYQAGLRQA
jgi:hypothetical protein